MRKVIRAMRQRRGMSGLARGGAGRPGAWPIAGTVAGAMVLAGLAGACGQRTDLRPVAGQSLPPPPFGASHRPGAAELLALPPQAAPERNIELRSVSEEREDDPFDLPPEG